MMTCISGPFCHSKVHPRPGLCHYQGGGEEGIIHDVPGAVITSLTILDTSLTPLSPKDVRVDIKLSINITSEGIVNSNIIYIC